MSNKNILLIDDNEIDNYITKQMLLNNKIGRNIITRSSAAEGLAYLKETEMKQGEMPDYIFLDIRMPEMDGFGFLDAFSSLSEAIKNHITVFMLTSSNDKR